MRAWQDVCVCVCVVPQVKRVVCWCVTDQLHSLRVPGRKEMSPTAARLGFCCSREAATDLTSAAVTESTRLSIESTDGYEPSVKSQFTTFSACDPLLVKNEEGTGGKACAFKRGARQPGRAETRGTNKHKREKRERPALAGGQQLALESVLGACHVSIGEGAWHLVWGGQARA